ncbi:MAG: hypothetical protein JWN04_5087 [Myxococcaceae bacterium]|nr:hypothetical protein [Myxococcaceae bacterium]
MTKQITTAALLLTLGYLAGTLAPSASASDGAAGIVAELKNIHSELSTIRRAIEKR